MINLVRIKLISMQPFFLSNIKSVSLIQETSLTRPSKWNMVIIIDLTPKLFVLHKIVSYICFKLKLEVKRFKYNEITT
jgi:hypothetical protein